MLLFIIFLFCDLLMVGVFFAVYGGKRPYAEGMLLGVHLPQEAADQAEVVALMDTFRRRTRRFYLVNLILGVAVCLVAFWRFSPFLILWCLWLVEFVIGAQWLLLGTHRTLYDLKMARGWVVGEPATLAAADTRASAQRRGQGPGLVWHLLPCGLILTTLLLPGVRDFLLTQGSGWGLLGSGLAISLTLWALHAVLSRRGNKVYSQDTAVNQAVNRLERQVWGWTLLLSSLFNAAAYWSAAWWMARAHWVGHTAYGIYLVLELLPAAIEVVVETGMASVSMLQRRLKLGYSRAARLVDQMEEKGVVGPFEGSKPRQVLITKDQWQEMQFKQGMVDAAPEPVPDELEFEGDAIPQSRDLPPFDMED